MKAGALVLLCVFCAVVECRKGIPINKHANLDFINMERGGLGQPAAQPQAKAPAAPTPAPAAPTPAPAATPTKPTTPPVAKPAPTPVTVKPLQPAQQPTQIKPVPVNPKPVTNPITTPGPGSVKALVNFYDSQGKASPIRPYSYSQAVKQG